MRLCRIEQHAQVCTHLLRLRFVEDRRGKTWISEGTSGPKLCIVPGLEEPRNVGSTSRLEERTRIQLKRISLRSCDWPQALDTAIDAFAQWLEMSNLGGGWWHSLAQVHTATGPNVVHQDFRDRRYLLQVMQDKAADYSTSISSAHQTKQAYTCSTLSLWLSPDEELLLSRTWCWDGNGISCGFGQRENRQQRGRSRRARSRKGRINSQSSIRAAAFAAGRKTAAIHVLSHKTSSCQTPERRQPIILWRWEWVG